MEEQPLYFMSLFLSSFDQLPLIPKSKFKLMEHYAKISHVFFLFCPMITPERSDWSDRGRMLTDQHGKSNLLNPIRVKIFFTSLCFLFLPLQFWFAWVSCSLTFQSCFPDSSKKSFWEQWLNLQAGPQTSPFSSPESGHAP